MRVHVNPDAADGVMVEWREYFVAYPRREGYSPGPVFSDARGREERGLYGLAEYLRRDGVVGVVVPDGESSDARAGTVRSEPAGRAAVSTCCCAAGRRHVGRVV